MRCGCLAVCGVLRIFPAGCTQVIRNRMEAQARGGDVRESPPAFLATLALLIPLLVSCSNPAEREAVRETAGSPVDSSRVPFGPNTSGLEARVYSDRTAYHAGDPIAVTVELKNTGSRPLKVFTNPRVVFSKSEFEVLDAQGRPVPSVRPPISSYAGSPELEPGKTVLFARGDLAKSFYLYKPGKYSVTFPRDSNPECEDYAAEPVSNAFTVEVLPSKVTNLFLVLVGSVLDRLPENWTLCLPEIGEAAFDRQSPEGRGRITIRRREADGEYGPEKIDLYINLEGRENLHLLCETSSFHVFCSTQGPVEEHWPGWRKAMAGAVRSADNKHGKGK